MRSARRDDLAAGRPAFGADVDDVVGDLDHVEVVFDDDHRIAAVDEFVEHIEQQAEQVGNNKGGGSSGTNDLGDDEDELIEEAIEVIMDCRQASTSMLQRRLKLGYSRAARIIDQIEDRGIIGPSEGSKPRQILISREDWQEMKLRRTMPLDKQQ